MPPPLRVIMVRRFDTDPTTLMAAWTKPQQIAGWWARSGAQLMFAEANPIAGGRFIFITRDADGGEHEYRGIYREIVPGDSIVIDWAKPAGRSLILQFWPIDGGTELTLTESPFEDAADRDARINRWSDALERLRTQVERRV